MPETAKPMGMFLQDPSMPELREDFDFAATGDFPHHPAACRNNCAG